jgi:transcriptional regulator with XRE-family HTH domain
MEMPKGMVRSHLKNRLSMMRIYRGFTIEQLAKLVKVSKGQVARWESDVHFPSEIMVDRLVRVLGCRRSDLFPFD